MAAAAPVPSLEAGDPSPGKVSFKETTEMIEATWGPGATNPNNALYTSAMMQAVQQYQVGKEERVVCTLQQRFRCVAERLRKVLRISERSTRED